MCRSCCRAGLLAGTSGGLMFRGSYPPWFRPTEIRIGSEPTTARLTPLLAPKLSREATIILSPLSFELYAAFFCDAGDMDPEEEAESDCSWRGSAPPETMIGLEGMGDSDVASFGDCGGLDRNTCGCGCCCGCLLALGLVLALGTGKGTTGLST